jgi:hypothetical protein
MNAIQSLPEAERDLVRRCLEAAANGPFFPEWEFHALFGLSRDEVRRVLETWRLRRRTSANQTLAVFNALGNLIGYPGIDPDAWKSRIGYSDSK